MPARPSEDELIARHFAPIAGPQGLGLRDDAALLTPRAGYDLVLTKDALVAGVHFFPDDPPSAIAKKALRVNLSDLAAKGAAPVGFLLALALPQDWTEVWLREFASGLGEDAAAFACPLFGGDTVKTPGPLMACVTAIGEVPRGGMAPRTGVRAGDRLYVTGTIGDAALGLRLRLGEGPSLAPEHDDFLRQRYLLPRPRLALAPAIATLANAAMDVSDGFVGDLAKMLRASGVGGRIDLANLPLSEAAHAACALDPQSFDVAATGGDDYELLAAITPKNCQAFEAAARVAGVAATVVGEAAAGPAPPLFLGIDGQEAKFNRASFSHF